MDAYAVIETGGKQYLVKSGERVAVERLDVEPGKPVSLDRVLAVSDGSALTLGAPCVAGASVTATVVEHRLAPKVVAFRKKKRKGYSHTRGHRQMHTVMLVDKIARA